MPYYKNKIKINEEREKELNIPGYKRKMEIKKKAEEVFAAPERTASDIIESAMRGAGLKAPKKEPEVAVPRVPSAVPELGVEYHEPPVAPTPKPTLTPEPTPTPRPTLTPAPAPTPEPTPTPRPAPRPMPLPPPTPAPTVEPLRYPTAVPAPPPAAPTPAPVVAPMRYPTAVPAPPPTAPPAPPTPTPERVTAPIERYRTPSPAELRVDPYHIPPEIEAKIENLREEYSRISAQNQEMPYEPEKYLKQKLPSEEEPYVDRYYNRLESRYRTARIEEAARFEERPPISRFVGLTGKALRGEPVEGYTTGNRVMDFLAHLTGMGLSLATPVGGGRETLGRMATQFGTRAGQALFRAAARPSERIAQTIAGGAAGMAPFSAFYAGMEDLKPREAIERILEETALGGIFGLGAGAGAAAAGKLARGRQMLTQPAAKLAEVPPKAEAAPVVPAKKAPKIVEPPAIKAVKKAKSAEKVIKKPTKVKKPEEVIKPVKDEAVVKGVPKKPIPIQKYEKEVLPQYKGVEPPKGIVQEVSPSIVKPIKKKDSFTFEVADAEIKAAKGIKPKTLYSKVKDVIDDSVKGFTRPYKTLPVTGEFAIANESLVLLNKAKHMAQDETIRILNDNSRGLKNIKAGDLFTYKILFNDLAQDAKRGLKLPFRQTPETVKTELAKLEKLMTPEIIESLAKRNSNLKNVVNANIKAMKAVGVDVSQIYKREDYFRHQVLEHVNERMIQTEGMGRKVRIPTKRGYQYERVGTEKAINTDYFEAESEVLSQMIHDTRVAKILKYIMNNYDISRKVKKLAKRANIENWRDAIPDGYEIYQLRPGNMFFKAKTISDRLAEKLLNNNLKELGLGVNDIKEVWAKGKPFKEIVVKKELAQTLNNFGKIKEHTKAVDLALKATGKWKSWILIGNPRTVIKYNIRNLSGDIDPLILMPSTVKKIPKAIDDLWQAQKYGKFSDDLKEFHDMGGYQSLYTYQELPHIYKLKQFERFREKTLAEKLKTPARKYFQFNLDVTNFREATSRFSTFLNIKEQLKQGKLKGYLASKKEVIDALPTIEQKAFRMGDDLHVSYDMTSEYGKMLSRFTVPFNRWAEGNIRRYVRVFKNMIDDVKSTQNVGEKIVKSLKIPVIGLKVAPKVAYKIGKYALMLSIISSGLNVWNELFFSEKEEKLPQDVKLRPHIILGEDKEGRTIHFSRLGALNDFLEWFGLGTISQDVRDVMNGLISFPELVVKMVNQPATKLVGGLNPMIKTPIESLARVKFYPEITRPARIRDVGEYLAGTVGLQEEYKLIAGKPMRPYFENLKTAIIYVADPKESSYYRIIDLKRKYEKRMGKASTGFFESNKSKALYNYKLAVRYKDEKAKEKYLAQYKKYGGTRRGLKQSLQRMDPLFGLSRSEKSKFLETLTTKERQALDLANEYYKEIIKSR